MAKKARAGRWSAIPAERTSANRLRFKLNTVIVVGIVCAACGPLGILVAAGLAGKTPELPPVANAEAIAYGEVAAEDYLNSVPTTVPLAKGIDPTWGTSSLSQKEALPHGPLTYAGSDMREAYGQNYQIDTYTFLSNGGLRAVAVTSVMTKTGPVIAASPSLVTVDLTSDTVDPLNYTDLDTFEEGTPNTAVTERVNQWAAAYASNDTAQLLVITGDPQTSTYKGLGEFEVANSVLVNGYVPDTVSGTYHGISVNDTAYVRVSVNLKSTTSELFSVTNEYDLLVSDINTSQPHIVAWGPAGSAPLVPFSNSNNF